MVHFQSLLLAVPSPVLICYRADLAADVVVPGAGDTSSCGVLVRAPLALLDLERSPVQCASGWDPSQLGGALLSYSFSFSTLSFHRGFVLWPLEVQSFSTARAEHAVVFAAGVA